MSDTKLDYDNPEHIQWLFETASARAQEFQITGVTYSLTQGVVKNIIPAIASTNAIIAGSCSSARSLIDQLAACCNEALKIATAMNPNLDNYMMCFLGLLVLTLSIGILETRPYTHTPFNTKRRITALFAAIFLRNVMLILIGHSMNSSNLSKKIPTRIHTLLHTVAVNIL